MENLPCDAVIPVKNKNITGKLQLGRGLSSENGNASALTDSPLKFQHSPCIEAQLQLESNHNVIFKSCRQDVPLPHDHQ